jgi:hypothetical protein
MGLHTEGYLAGPGTLGSTVGVRIDSGTSSAGTGTVTDAIGAQIRVLNQGSGTITNAYGLYVMSDKYSGTISNMYGLYIATLSGTNKYGIYQAGPLDTNRFTGRTGIGGEPDVTAALKVTGTSYFTDTIKTNNYLLLSHDVGFVSQPTYVDCKASSGDYTNFRARSFVAVDGGVNLTKLYTSVDDDGIALRSIDSLATYKRNRFADLTVFGADLDPMGITGIMCVNGSADIRGNAYITDNVNITSLTASRMVGTDANKNLVSIAFGASAGTVAEGNHAHSTLYAPLTHGVSAGYIPRATSTTAFGNSAIRDNGFQAVGIGGDPDSMGGGLKVY